jgi:hypothetical protein
MSTFCHLDVIAFNVLSFDVAFVHRLFSLIRPVAKIRALLFSITNVETAISHRIRPGIICF